MAQDYQSGKKLTVTAQDKDAEKPGSCDTHLDCVDDCRDTKERGEYGREDNAGLELVQAGQAVDAVAFDFAACHFWIRFGRYSCDSVWFLPWL